MFLNTIQINARITIISKSIIYKFEKIMGVKYLNTSWQLILQ